MPQNNTKKTYLILSASYGSGHVRAAEAVAEHLTSAGHTAIHRDLLSFVRPNTAKLFRAPYIFLMRHAPNVYGILYRLLMHTWILTIVRHLYSPILKYQRSAIITYLSDVHPDYIICTHFTWGEILDSLIRRNLSVAPYYMVVTDYTYHSLWKNTYCAGYFLGAEDVRAQFLSAQIPQQLLHVTGIPVSPLFAQTYSQSKQSITILLGGYGLTFPKQYINSFIHTHTDTAIHIICGNNPRLVTRLRSRYAKSSHVTIHGWCNNVHEYICNSKIVVTKTGGITITECLVASIPIEALPPIPGQETENYFFLKKHNLLNPNTKKNTGQIPVFNISSVPFLF